MHASKMCAEEAGCSRSVDALLSNTTSGGDGMAAAAWLSVPACLPGAASPRASLAVLSLGAQRALGQPASCPAAGLFPPRQGGGEGCRLCCSASGLRDGSSQADKKSHVGARTIIKTEVFSELLFW